MSTGVAETSLSFVAPHVTYPAVHFVNPVPHLIANAGHVIHPLIAPAAVCLGALSAGVLAARAAVATAQGLALATVRAAEAQRCLQQGRMKADEVAAAWNDAMFAVVKVNARITALQGWHQRVGGPGGGPPTPPPIEPVGCSLEAVYALINETDRTLRQAEADLQLSIMKRAEDAVRQSAPAAAPDPAHEAWRRRVAGHRAAALAKYAAAADAEAAEVVFAAPEAFETQSAGIAAVEHTAAMLMGALDRDATPQEYALIGSALDDAVRAAAEKPRAVRRFLLEARTLTRTANDAARRRREEREQLAAQLNFLRDRPKQPASLPDATLEVAVLEAALASGAPLTEAQQGQVFQRCSEWASGLERQYKTAVIELALLDDADGTETGYAGVNQFEFRPKGWPAEYWMRVSVDQSGVVRVVTRRQGRSEETETGAQRELDRHYCELAKREVGEISAMLSRAGIEADLHLVDARVEPVPGDPPGAQATRRTDRYRPDGPKARTVPDGDR